MLLLVFAAALAGERTLLFDCGIAPVGQRSAPFALLFRDGHVAEEFDPSDRYPLTSAMGQSKAWRPGYVSLELPPYAGELPHGGLYMPKGELGALAEFYLGRGMRSRVIVTHWRAAPAGQTLVFEGVCSVRVGHSAVSRWKALTGHEAVD